MPYMTGLEARVNCAILSGIAHLIFTELRGHALREECLRSGADGFVEKSEMPKGSWKRFAGFSKSLRRNEKSFECKPHVTCEHVRDDLPPAS